MIRKYFISLLLSLVTLIASARISVGQWKIHPYFVGDIITNCVDTKDKVYYLSESQIADLPFFYSQGYMPVDMANLDAGQLISDATLVWSAE